MAVLETRVVEKNSGAAVEVKTGQRLRITGKSIVDFVAFNLHDLQERFDQARTKTNQVKIFISIGDVLYSKRNNPMLTIVEDTFKEGRHDLQKGMSAGSALRWWRRARQKESLRKESISIPNLPKRFPIMGAGRI